MSDSTAQRIFKARCYDEGEEDPWQWMGSSSQEYLPEGMEPLRASLAQAFLAMFNAVAWFWFVAIDPCRSLLPKNETKKQEQLHAAMGKMGWRSKKAIRQGINGAKVKTANTQASGSLSVPQARSSPLAKILRASCGKSCPGPCPR